MLGRVGDGLLSAPPLDVRMHHIALNRPRPYDRDLDDEIVESPRPHAGQKAHLGPALDLEHADRVGGAKHVVHGRILLRYGGQRMANALPDSKEIECFLDAGQHSERKDVDFKHADGIDIVLVPFDDRAAVHSCVLNRAELVEPSARNDESAHMLREMARESDDLAGKLQRLAKSSTAEIHFPSGSGCLLIFVFAQLADMSGERRHGILGIAHDSADFAEGSATSEVHYGRADACAMAAVFLVDVLDDFFAPLVLEVDIDVGRLLAGFGYEPLEHH